MFHRLHQSKQVDISPYIKDLSNRWVTFDGETVISCADHFCEKESDSERKLLKKCQHSKLQLGRQKLPIDWIGPLYTARFLVCLSCICKKLHGVH